MAETVSDICSNSHDELQQRHQNGDSAEALQTEVKRITDGSRIAAAIATLLLKMPDKRFGFC